MAANRNQIWQLGGTNFFVVDNEELVALESLYDISTCGCKSDPHGVASYRTCPGLVSTAILARTPGCDQSLESRCCIGQCG
eukprot:117457-Hanusia_phi.AAC.2